MQVNIVNGTVEFENYTYEINHGTLTGVAQPHLDDMIERNKLIKDIRVFDDLKCRRNVIQCKYNKYAACIESVQFLYRKQLTMYVNMRSQSTSNVPYDHDTFILMFNEFCHKFNLQEEVNIIVNVKSFHIYYE